MALSATLRLREVQKKLLDMTYKERQSRRDAEHWEYLYQYYKRLTTIDDGPDTDPASFADSSIQSWEVEGADSTPPDSWTILTP